MSTNPHYPGNEFMNNFNESTSPTYPVLSDTSRAQRCHLHAITYYVATTADLSNMCTGMY